MNRILLLFVKDLNVVKLNLLWLYLELRNFVFLEMESKNINILIYMIGRKMSIFFLRFSYRVIL